MNLPTTPSSIPSSSTGIRRRLDLVCIETRHKNESAVVIKDPIALKYHRLRPDEFFVLELLDGKISLRDIRIAYERRFAPTSVTESELNQLLFRFHQNGLTISDAPLQGDRLRERREKETWQQRMQYINGVLFMRFPGYDPEPLLRQIYPFVAPLFGFIGKSLAICLCLFAFITFVGQSDRFGSEFPQMTQWLKFESLIILAIVISATKVFHELGHALTCKHHGGECHQIGPMLLVFTPALYCDTSDSWMFANRWHRAAVGMAGIVTEVILAAMATLVWAWTGEGTVHYIAMNVMLVCSVSTVMFNANPLLRYDGYYVLSDICDVPNLGDKSRRLLSSAASRFFLGVNEDDPELSDGSTHFWLYVYAIAAFIYRWTLTLLILWLVSMILRPYGLESLGRLLCIFAAGAMLFTLLRTPFNFLRNPARRRKIEMKRVAFSVVLLGACVALALWPMSSTTSGSARIVPRSEQPVYVATAGQLKAVIAQPGEYVELGSELIRLENHEVDLQYLQAKGRVDVQREIVASIKSSQFSNPEAANELPAAEALLEELEKQLASRSSRRDALVVRAQVPGKIIAAPKRADIAVADDEFEQRLVSWQGYPTDPQNEGCFLESGVEVMSISTDDQWDAEIALDQSLVQRIEVGTKVKLALESNPGVAFGGEIKSISKSRWRAGETSQRRDDPDAVRQHEHPSTSYVVRVELYPNNLGLTTGTLAIAQLQAKPISLAGRAWRLLNGIFRFR